MSPTASSFPYRSEHVTLLLVYSFDSPFSSQRRDSTGIERHLAESGRICSTVAWPKSVRASRRSVECSVIASACGARAMVRACRCRTVPSSFWSGIRMFRRKKCCFERRGSHVGRVLARCSLPPCEYHIDRFFPFSEGCYLSSPRRSTGPTHWLSASASGSLPPQELSSQCGVVWRLWSEDEEKRLERLVEASLARRHIPSSAVHGSSQPSSLQVRNPISPSSAHASQPSH